MLRFTKVLTKRNFNPLRFYSTGVNKLSIEEFIQEMKKASIHRGYIVYDKNQVYTSSPLFQQLADFVVNDKRDFLEHEAIFIELSKETQHLFAAFIHKTVRGQAQGGVRYWPYSTMEAFVRDGLRLSLGMGRKNSLAGLWWGGGKGVIARRDNVNFKDEKFRDALFGEYGKFLTSLRGAYLGAEDVGLTPADTKRMFHHARFVTCIPQEIGGSGNPSNSTAKGVVCAMNGALDFFNKGSVKGKKIAVQGLGNVASFMIEDLLRRGVGKVIATDIQEDVVNKAKERFKDHKNVEISLVTPDDVSILSEPCDILAPCALGGILNSQTIPKIKAPIVCGAANNQLLDPVKDDQALKDRGITYVPDYVCNRMGIVNCANEQYGYVTNDPMIERHFSEDWENSVFVVTKNVLKESQKSNIPTGQAANKLADEQAQIPHPIFGHRSRLIIQSLIKDGWDKKSY